jgi:hypothetical protein
MNPEITLNLIRERRYGVKAMERRVKDCCADNPGCPYQEKCSALYDEFVDVTDTRRDIYSQLRELGVGGIEARANLSIKRVKELAVQTP